MVKGSSIVFVLYEYMVYKLLLGDENGVYTGQFTTFALCGFVRAQGDADSALDRLWAKKKAELGQ